jgi:hypothetical protein
MTLIAVMPRSKRPNALTHTRLTFVTAFPCDRGAVRLLAADLSYPRPIHAGVVERTIGWLNRCRRLAKDWECLNRSALAFLRWASVRLMLRRLCQASK